MHNEPTYEPGHASGDASLTTTVVRGAGWMFAGKLAGRGLAVIKLIVLARLLSPDDFGLFGLMMLATMALDTFTRTGFDKALIQFPADAHTHLDTAWTIQILRGLALAGLLYAGAPLAAWFFDEPRITPLLRVFCVAPVIAGFDNIGIVYLMKNLNYVRQVFFTLCIDTTAMIVGIALALQFRNVWALVGATLTACVVRNVLSYVMHPYRPRLAMKKESVRRLLGYGVWLLGSSILVFVSVKGDRIVLGHLLGASALGIFGVAVQIADLPASQITVVLNNVMMPAYAKAQGARDRLGRAFVRVLELVATLSLPLTALLVFAAPEIILGLIGEQWAAAIRPLQILALVSLVQSIDGTTTPLYLGTGHPRLQFTRTLIRGVVTLALVIPLTLRWGVSGTALADLAGIAILIPLMKRALRIAGVPVARTLTCLAPGVLLSLCVLIGVHAARFLPLDRPLWVLIAAALFSAALSVPVVWFQYRLYGTGPLRLIKDGAWVAGIRRPKQTGT